MVLQLIDPIIIAGPTGSGKSAFAMQIAKDLDGEIICADSRQIYQRMSIGTACPTQQDYAKIPHHGFEKLDPREKYSAGQFIADTDAYVQEIISRKRTPILVGGTGLYLRAWRFGLDDVLPADVKIREKLDHESLETLYIRLQQVDPVSAGKIKPEDPVRIKRALEIYELTGQPASTLRQTDWTRKPRVPARWILLNPPNLDERLKARVVSMFEEGLVQEALALRDYLGSDDPHERLKTPGYLEALQMADGEITQEQALELTFRRHRQYAKRQNTWFKKEGWWEHAILVA